MKKTKTQMDNCYNIVLQLLKDNEEYRKNEMLLLQRFYSDMLGKDVGKMQFKTVLNLILKGPKNGGLYAIDTVCRASRKVREDYPELNDLETQKQKRQKELNIINFTRSKKK